MASQRLNRKGFDRRKALGRRSPDWRSLDGRSPDGRSPDRRALDRPALDRRSAGRVRSWNPPGHAARRGPFAGQQFVLAERVLGLQAVGITGITRVTGVLGVFAVGVTRGALRTAVAWFLAVGLTPGRHILARPLPKLTTGGRQYVIKRDVPAPRYEQAVEEAVPGGNTLVTMRL